MKYDYGDAVILTIHDQSGNVSRRPCAVVGITCVENEARSRALGRPLGSTLYTVEFGDGSDQLVLEEALEPDDDA